MQTKHRIQQLLASAGVNPNKRHGQNFLIDLNLMEILLDSADLSKDDVVLEVGCGTGSLTDELVKKAGRVIVSEIDETMARITSLITKGAENLQIINKDALKGKHELNPEIIDAVEKAKADFKGKFKLISNLPYSAGTPIVINLVTGKLKADEIYVTVQKEVAERMTAGTGDKDYGILGVFMQATGYPEIIREIPATAFWPPPQVKSSIVSYKRNDEKMRNIKDIQIFEQLVHLFFQHKRKMLRASVKLAEQGLAEVKDWQDVFEQTGINPQCRPADITPEEYVLLADTCSQKMK